MIRIAIASVFFLSVAAPVVSIPRADAARRHHDRRKETDHPLPSISLRPPPGSKNVVSTPGRAPAVAFPPLETFVLASFDFEDGRDGWMSVDRTAQLDTFWHVADSTELSGGNFGSLLVLEGEQSLWCGAAPSSGPELCSWVSLPGYGNSWHQQWTSMAFPRVGDVHLSYKIQWDVEPYEDRIYIEYLNKDGVWATPLPIINPPFNEYYDGDGLRIEQITFPDTALGDSVRVRFRVVTDGAWSNQDGLWPTDGACVLDSLTLSDDGGILSYQDFESESVGAHATSDGHWQGHFADEAFGDFSDVYPGVGVLQEDICASNYGLWGSFDGSPDTYACGGHPEQAAVPSARLVQGGWGPFTAYMDNEIWSPPVDWETDAEGAPVPASAASAWLEFDVYTDLPLDNLVFYMWRVRAWIDSCPAPWTGSNFVYFSAEGEKGWRRDRFQIGSYVDPAAEQVQVALRVADMCWAWCGIYGTGLCHSHAPLFDNVRIVREGTAGPAWDPEATRLFQDNFPADGTKTGTVRIDASFAGGQLSDSACVSVFSPVGIDDHIHGDPGSGPAVYCHVADLSAAKSGSAISGNPTLYPVVSAGGGWTVLQCTDYCVDLNDNLFTPGDTIEYYFSARDANGNTNYWSADVGIVLDEAAARARPGEVTCLPANAGTGKTDILYIDDYGDPGARRLFESAFEMLGLQPDRYDVLALGPATRVVDVVEQLAGCYRTIIWNSGDLVTGTIGDSNGPPVFSDDFSMLLEFLDQSPNGPGLYISGDNVAGEWETLSGAGAIGLRSQYMSFILTNGDHVAAGQPVSPLVVGESGSCFDHPPADTAIAFGGCPHLGSFDILQPSGAAQLEMSFSGDPTSGAVVAQATTNSVGDTARVVLSGFSYHRLHDDIEGQFPIDRVDHLRDILQWLRDEAPSPTAATDSPRFVNELLQNYPNPFNPSTTIRYSIAASARVRLEIYDVMGRRVRMLVDEIQKPRPGGLSVLWNGEDGRGQPVASGVYYYRLVSGGFVQAKKMILLR